MGKSASRKIKSLAVLAQITRHARTQGQRIVFTNGCFDLLHAGHIRTLEQAKRLGDILIVGINSDRSVRALKGKKRPIIQQQERALLLAALESIDYVIVFHEPTPLRLIEHLKPDVLVKGADWAGDEIVGRTFIEKAGGKVVRIPLFKGRSTSNLIERIRSLG
ncbi:MAG: D-glycero-beta-D-manno-heptose 1-phosphate adenylyltransferase [Candidatus Omnitrophica bacterium]|nr:D-glycero-beta-D-manno-heptose 1-phosphate adenylyltransferase [Candidatus Omnitrophota bacterium]